MSLTVKIADLTTRIATEFKSIRLVTGALGSLNTSNKTNLVAAINEVLAAAGSVGTIDSNSISDATTLGKALLTAVSAGAARTELDVYTKSEVDAAAAAAASALVAGAPGALDTLAELATALGGDANFATTTATALGNRVRVDASQTFTGPQKAQGRANLDVYSITDIGDPTTDFVAQFETALA